MSKYFIIWRSLLILALLVLLVAIIWGMTHRTRPTTAPELSHVEQYMTNKSSSNWSIFFITCVILGIAIVSFSIYLEYWRTRKVSSEGDRGADPAALSTSVRERGGETDQPLAKS